MGVVKETCWSGREQTEWKGGIDDHIYSLRECLPVSSSTSCCSYCPSCLCFSLVARRHRSMYTCQFKSSGSMFVSDIFRGASAAGANVRDECAPQRHWARWPRSGLRVSTLRAAFWETSSTRATGDRSTSSTRLSWSPLVASWTSLRSPVCHPSLRGRRDPFSVVHCL